MHEALIVEPPLAEEEAVVRALKDGRVVQLALLFEAREDAADILIHIDQPRVVVLRGLFERARAVRRGSRPNLVVCLVERLRLAGVAFQIVIEGGGLWNRNAVVEIEVPPGTEEVSMRRSGTRGGRQKGLSPRSLLIHSSALSVTRSSAYTPG